jgi:hypothetical protein
MEVDVVHHRAVVVVLEAHLDRVADADPHERTRHLVVEGPVTVGRAVGELADDFGRIEIDLHALRTTRPDWGWQIGWIAHDRDSAIALDMTGGRMGVRHRPARLLRAKHLRPRGRRGFGGCWRVDGDVAQANHQAQADQGRSRYQHDAVVPVARHLHGSPPLCWWYIRNAEGRII